LSLAVSGVPYNCFALSCGKSQLATAISSFNSTVAGTKDLRGNTIKPITLPASYEFGAPKYNTDLRLTKEFSLRVREQARMEVFVEGFNIFNIANLTGYSFVLGPSFGQP